MAVCVRASLLCALLLLLASPGGALTITIDAHDSGWFNDNGDHTASNQNYAIGWDGSDQLRNFVAFDISDLVATSETLLSATLRLHNPEAGVPTAAWTDGYTSPEATETYELHEVLLLPDAPAANQLANFAVYDDLGNGPVFGSYVASAADNGTDVDIALNAAGIAALEAAVGPNYVLGGVMSTIDHTGQLVEELFFGNTDPPGTGPNLGPQTRQLILVLTPEPGTGLLLGLGIVAMGCARRRLHA